MPVTVVVSEPGVVMVADGPLIWLQVPVPMEGALPAIVAVPGAVQMFWSGPAALVVGGAFTVIVIAVDVAVIGDAHVAVEVITTRIRSPFTKSVSATPVYVTLVAPLMSVPFLVHW